MESTKISTNFTKKYSEVEFTKSHKSNYKVLKMFINGVLFNLTECEHIHFAIVLYMYIYVIHDQNIAWKICVCLCAFIVLLGNSHGATYRQQG